MKNDTSDLFNRMKHLTYLIVSRKVHNLPKSVQLSLIIASTNQQPCRPPVEVPMRLSSTPALDGQTSPEKHN